MTPLFRHLRSAVHSFVFPSWPLNAPGVRQTARTRGSAEGFENGGHLYGTRAYQLPVNQHEWRRLTGGQRIEGRVAVGALETVEIDIENREAVSQSVDEFALQTLDLPRHGHAARGLVGGHVQGAENFGLEEE